MSRMTRCWRAHLWLTPSPPPRPLHPCISAAVPLHALALLCGRVSCRQGRRQETSDSDCQVENVSGRGTPSLAGGDEQCLSSQVGVLSDCGSEDHTLLVGPRQMPGQGQGGGFRPHFVECWIVDT